MNVILHEGVGIKLNRISNLTVGKIREVSCPVLIVKKDVLALVSSGDNMIQSTWKMDTWFASHESLLS
jgi:hypothetical protein